MTAVAFVHPGQSSQAPGMGAALYASDPELYERFVGGAERAAGLPLRELAVHGSLDELTQTEVAQPLVFSLSLALAALAADAGLRPDFVAGHSLGEYTAVVVAGGLPVDEAMALVARRGALMAAAQRERPGAMAAIARLEPAALEELCTAATGDGGVVAVAAFNSPRQTVVSGDVEGIERLLAVASARGITAMRIASGGAFHSPLMDGVAVDLAQILRVSPFEDPRLPIVANVSAELTRSVPELEDALVRQVTQPVRWVQSVERLVACGVTTFVEVGPGGVLSPLIRQAAPGVEVHTVNDRAQLDELAAWRPELFGRDRERA